jgi:hypothetical protein
MLIVTVVAFFLPVPGSTLIGIGLIAMTAELHRAIARRFGFRGRRRIAVGGGPLAPNPSR